MPIYEYRCEECRQKMRVMHAVALWETVCPVCDGPLVLLLSDPNIIKTEESEPNLERRVETHIEDAREGLEKQKEERRKDYAI